MIACAAVSDVALSTTTLRIRSGIGTSGFSYKEWRPAFYPADISEKQFLQYYSTRLNSVEIDYTAGYAGGDAVESFGYDFGVTYYTYLSASTLNTAEIYAGLTKGWFSGKLWYSDDYASTSNSGFYLEGNAAIPVPSVEGLSVLAHIGVGDVQQAKSAIDYSVGVGYNVGNFATTLKYIDGDTDNAFSYDNRFVFAISTTLPWAE